MELQKISHLLEKFKGLAISRDTIKRESARTIFEKTGITIDLDHLNIQNNTIFIKDTPAVKSIVFTKKEPILAELKKTLQKKAPTDIR